MEGAGKGFWVCALLCLVPRHTEMSLLPLEECRAMKMMELEREKCLEDPDNHTAVSPSPGGCERMWDNITCWPAAEVGQVVVLPCPLILTVFSNRHGSNVTRNCSSHGWSELTPALYTTACGYEILPVEEKGFYLAVKMGYTIGYSLSLITLTAATTILCLFRKLRCTRNFIHTHLFASFIMRAIAVFLKDFVLYENEDVDPCTPGSVGCKAVIVFFQYCVMANYLWLLVESLYLHMLLAISFFSERKYFWWYIMIGWGVPGVFISVWTITKTYFDDFGCWDVISSQYWWIIKVPIVTSILVSFTLFICIIRILVQKLHPPDVGRSETNQYTRLAKSTLLLIPLFGAHYITFAFFPDNFKMEVKVIFELLLGSFQGFVVAILYCFLNGEVQAELKRKWRRWRLEHFLGSDPKYHQPSLASNGTNYSTQISMLAKSSPHAQRSASFQAELSLV
ncbi:vasoactive intestinal polypeptide receptor 1 isoform X1 [Ornithorhynchus anatinus]|uniref:vasoactive intestinal polypeptide receptor 1 isoform X1 n=1 Tax=Ornithorhynchus anatinus TaxID=9258 RepID=UPI0010A7F4C5|nr:vasoactive intestinal polypeptide receptor 1 isoform X1 [Ornithorhynchus anatinus]